MKNLAGVSTCDTDIVRELLEAKIQVVPRDRSKNEVSASFIGELNDWHFIRAWYYWVAIPINPNKGLSMDKASILYQKYGKDARVDGDCTAPAPYLRGQLYHMDGRKIVIDPNGEQLASFKRFNLPISDHMFVPALGFIHDNMVQTVIEQYHIDTQAALNAFADIIRV